MLSLHQIANGLESLLARLPAALRKPVEAEWRPVQALFLRRRAPRLLLAAPSEPHGEPAPEWLRALLQLDEPLERHALPGDGPWLLWRGTGARPGRLEFAVARSRAALDGACQPSPPDLLIYLEGQTPEPAEAGPLRGIPWLQAREGLSREALLAAIAERLPLETQVEFARLSRCRPARHAIAERLTRSCTAVCAAIGAQPIPLADLPILTALQLLMVAGIVQTAGREMNARLARDFLAALGVNVGLGFLLRETARTASKLIPGWGMAISGGIAAAGTYAMGRAASAYFIDGASLKAARRVFDAGRETGEKPPLPPPQADPPPKQE